MVSKGTAVHLSRESITVHLSQINQLHNILYKLFILHVEALGKLAEDHDSVSLVGQLGQQSVQYNHLARGRNDLFGHLTVLGTCTCGENIKAIHCVNTNTE